MSQSQEAGDKSEFKPCVLCAEPIRRQAIVCPYCGSGQTRWTRRLHLFGLSSVQAQKRTRESSEAREGTKPCTWCAEPIRLTAEVCPHCRRLQRQFLRRAWFIGLVELALLGGLLVWGLLTLREMLQPGRSFAPYQSQIVVVYSEKHWSQRTNSNFISVIGALRNDSPLAWRDIELEVRFFDASGRLIDTVSETLDATVAPAALRGFRVRSVADKAESAYARHEVLVRWAKEARFR